MTHEISIIIACCVVLFIIAICYLLIQAVVKAFKQNSKKYIFPQNLQPHSLITKEQITSVDDSVKMDSVKEILEQLETEIKLTLQKEKYLSGLRNYSIGLKDIPVEYWSEDLLICAIESNISDIELIPPEKKTFNLCAVATLMEIKKKYIPNDFGVQYSENIDYDLCKKLVDKNPKLLLLIPKEYKTEELKDIAVSSEYWALSLLPTTERTYERCMSAFTRNSHAIRFFPSEILSEQFCRKAIAETPLVFKSIPKRLLNSDLIKYAVTVQGKLLEYVDPYLIDEEVCILAVEDNYHAIKFVPRSCRTPSVLLTFSACVERNLIADTSEALTVFLNCISSEEYIVAAQGFSRHLSGLKFRDLECITGVQSHSIEVDLHSMHKEEAKEFVSSLLSNVNVGTVNQLIFIHGFNQGTVLLNMLRDEIEHPRIKQVYRDLHNNGITIFEIA